MDHQMDESQADANHGDKNTVSFSVDATQGLPGSCSSMEHEPKENIQTDSAAGDAEAGRTSDVITVSEQAAAGDAEAGHTSDVIKVSEQAAAGDAEAGHTSDVITVSEQAVGDSVTDCSGSTSLHGTEHTDESKEGDADPSESRCEVESGDTGDKIPVGMDSGSVVEAACSPASAHDESVKESEDKIKTNVGTLTQCTDQGLSDTSATDASGNPGAKTYGGHLDAGQTNTGCGEKRSADVLDEADNEVKRPKTDETVQPRNESSLETNGLLGKMDINSSQPLDGEARESNTDCVILKSESFVDAQSSSAGSSAPTWIHDSQTKMFPPEEIVVSDTASEASIVISDSASEANEKQVTQDEVASKDVEYIQTSFSYEDDFSKTPTLVSCCQEEYASYSENYLKGCKWSPDGTCLLTNSNDHCLRIFNLPQELYEGKAVGLPEMSSVLRMSEGEPIYDYCWLPTMSSQDPASCCLVSTSREAPVHLWDAFTGQLRSSYRAFDQMDELTTAHSLAFSPDSTKLYCGFDKKIRIFDVSRPGRDCQTRKTHNKKKGQSGIISCIAVKPTNPNVYAAGSYSREVGMYSEPKGDMVCMFKGQQGGVTHIMFSLDGNQLYTGGRKDPEILCWDLRNPGQVLFSVMRNVATNQRMYFDLDSTGRYLLSGNHDGTVGVWDTQDLIESEQASEPVAKSVLSYKAHSEGCNGISVHPSMPLVATSCGQRHFPIPSMSTDSDSEQEECTSYENSLKLWWTGY